MASGKNRRPSHIFIGLKMFQIGLYKNHLMTSSFDLVL